MLSSVGYDITLFAKYVYFYILSFICILQNAIGFALPWVLSFRWSLIAIISCYRQLDANIIQYDDGFALFRVSLYD